MYVVGPGFLLALLTQGQVFCWPNCHRARFFAGPNTPMESWQFHYSYVCRRARFFVGPTVAGPGFLLALLLQGQVFCWPYCPRARFFAGPTASGPGFLLALKHPWRADIDPLIGELTLTTTHNIFLLCVPELINSIEITIAIDIFCTIAISIAIVKRISQLLLLLLLLIRSSISIDFFSCLEYVVSELLQWA